MLRARAAPTTNYIMALLLPQVAALLVIFPRYAFTRGGGELRIFSVCVAIFALLTLAGLRGRRPWALWAALTLVSLALTIDLFAWSLGVNRVAMSVALILLAAVTVLVFRKRSQAILTISPYQRVLFALVFVFAAWVGVWGFFFPTLIGSAIPLSTPPLHARFLGAMYFSGTAFMLFGLFARAWREVRVITLILGVWTGMLGVVSLLHFSAFDWSKTTVWFWFFAYICYPLVALWIVWLHRGDATSTRGPAISRKLRAYLIAQGVVATVLATFLLAAPRFMTTVWPWTITALLAQIYSAPFFSYGIGSLYAARQRSWSEVRILVIGTLVFTLAVLVASLLHLHLFGARFLAALLWFGIFGVASLALLLFSVVPSLRERV